MAKIKTLLAGKQLVYHRSENPTKLMVITALALSMAALIALHLSIGSIHADTADLRRRAAALEQNNSEMINDIQDLGSVQSVIKIAQKELGLVNPDAVAIRPQS